MMITFWNMPSIKLCGSETMRCKVCSGTQNKSDFTRRDVQWHISAPKQCKTPNKDGVEFRVAAHVVNNTLVNLVIASVPQSGVLGDEF